MVTYSKKILLLQTVFCVFAWGTPPEGFYDATGPIIGARCNGDLSGNTDDRLKLEQGLNRYRKIYIPANKTCVIQSAIRVRSGAQLIGEDKDTSIIHNIYPGGSKTNYRSNVLLIGNWGGQPNTKLGALWVPPYTPIDPVVARTNSVHLTSSSLPTTFSKGEIIGIKSSEVFPDPKQDQHGNTIYLPKYVQINKIKSINGSTIYLEEPLNFSFGSHPLIANLSKATDDTGLTGLDDKPFYIAQFVEIRNLTLSSSTPIDRMHSVFHGSAYKLRMSNLNLIGKRGPGCNPCGYSTFKNIDVLGIDEVYEGKPRYDTPSSMMGFEMTYMSNNVLIDDLYIQTGILNLAEVGSHITVRNSTLDDGRIGTSYKHDLLLQNIVINKCTTQVQSPAVVIINKYNENNTIDNLTILDPGANQGVRIKGTSKNAKLLNSELHYHKNGQPPYVIEAGANATVSNVSTPILNEP